MKKLIVAAFCLFSIGINAQMQEEKILEDGTHVITYVPRNFTKEELDFMRPRRIPTTEQLMANPTIPFSNSCMNKLEGNFNKRVDEDTSLAKVCENYFLEHVNANFHVKENEHVRFRQIWTLQESILNYNHLDLSESFIEGIRSQHLQDAFGKNCKFYCHEFQHNGKYYVVAVLND